MSIKKRAAVVAARGFGFAALVGAVVVGYAGTAHASSATNDPYVLSSTYLSSQHANPGYAKLGPQGAAKGEVGKVNHGHPTSNGIPGIEGVSNWNGSWSEAGFDASGNANSTWIYQRNGLTAPAFRHGETGGESPVAVRRRISSMSSAIAPVRRNV